MATRRALLVDAFTTEPLSGNAAGVVPDAAGLSDRAMQAVARELNASETAFLLPSDDADRRVRYFTPEQEVDLCGHATVGAHAFLASEGVVDESEHTLETNVGVLDIVIEDGTVWMTQNPPEIREVDVDYADAAAALGVRETALTGMREDLPLARSTTGLPFLMIPVEYLSDLSEMAPDKAAIADISEAHDCAGVFAFTFDTLESESTLHARMFAPAAGVPEDPVTGTASGACGAYLDRFGAFDPTPEEMVFEQGHFVDRPGRALVRASDATTEGDVQVGGEAVVTLDGDLDVPEFEDDEIIEA
jgi:PhzF family phenazine biosynthesis protein